MTNVQNLSFPATLEQVAQDPPLVCCLFVCFRPGGNESLDGSLILASQIYTSLVYLLNTFIDWQTWTYNSLTSVVLHPSSLVIDSIFT